MVHSRYLRAAGQVQTTQSLATPVPGTCPAPPYCPSLPSSDSAYRALSGGGLSAWVEVAGSTLLRGLLISAGLKLFDWNDPKVLQRGLAGAMGIEAFVLAYTLCKMPQASSPSV